MTATPLPESAQKIIAEGAECCETVWFDPTMDHLVYLEQECNYRADRVDDALTLLHLPHANALVGVKIKGIRADYESLFDSFARPDSDFIEFLHLIGAKLFEQASRDDMADLAAGRREVWQQKYQTAKRFVASKARAVSPRDLDQIALTR